MIVSRARKTTYPSREQWLQARRRHIGSSDVPAILGHGYADQSPYSVWADKVSDQPEKLTKTKAKLFQRGQIAEELVLRLWEIEHEKDVDRHSLTIYEHASYPFLAASLDSSIRGQDPTAPVEAKYVGPQFWSDWDADKPPLRHAIQVQHQLDCVGGQVGYLVGLCGHEIKVFTIERSERFLTFLRPRLVEFWEKHVLARTPPPVDFSDATRAALERLFPADVGTACHLDSTFAALLDKRQRAKDRIKRLEQIAAAAENKIKERLGEHAYGLLDDGRAVSWKLQERAGYTVEATSFRQFRVLAKHPKGVLEG
jgi:putative phage-type endonuclease